MYEDCELLKATPVTGDGGGATPASARAPIVAASRAIPSLLVPPTSVAPRHAESHRDGGRAAGRERATERAGAPPHPAPIDATGADRRVNQTPI